MKKSKGYPYAIKESKSVSAYSGYTTGSSIFFTLTTLELKILEQKVTCISQIIL